MASDREKTERTKSGSNVKHIPKDAQVIMSILKELGIIDYEPRVINQLLEFTYRKYKLPFVWVEVFCHFLFYRICDMHFRRCKNIHKSCKEENY